MLQIAFLRNVNQGQRGHLSTADLRDAFADAGVGDAVPFQSNGTVVFSGDDPGGVVDEVVRLLAVRGVFDDAAYTRPLSFVEDVVDRYADRVDGARCELTLFPTGRVIDVDAPLVAAATRRRCEVIEDGRGFAVVRNDRDRQSNGTPTIEAVLQQPATSRGLPTLVRLVDRFSR